MNDHKARRTVIDTDPGIDDAIAILLALSCPEFDVAGIMTLAGNIGLDATTRNAGRLLAFAGRDDIPLIPGARSPLVRPAPEPLSLHGDDGIGGVPLPEPARPPLQINATEWLANLLDSSPPSSIDILALGPLTNIAKLVQERPGAARRIGRLIVMGGAIHEKGNVGSRSEFNLAADPEAASLVLSAGLPLQLIPLDVTRRVRATRDLSASLAQSIRPAAKLVSQLIDVYFESGSTRESRPLHDPCVMLAALEPESFEFQALSLNVDTSTGENAGALVLDAKGGEIAVAMSVDAAAVLHLLENRLCGLKGEVAE